MGMETRSPTHARYALSVGIILNLPTCVQGARVEEIMASASLIMIGHAAFHAVEQYPGASLTLRQGTLPVRKSPAFAGARARSTKVTEIMRLKRATTRAPRRKRVARPPWTGQGGVNASH
jgi:hypothetical protein